MLPRVVFLNTKSTQAITRSVIRRSTEMDRICEGLGPKITVSTLLPSRSTSRLLGADSQEMVRLLLSVLATLWAMPEAPKVAIKGGTFIFVTTNPFREPNSVPQMRPARMET